MRFLRARSGRRAMLGGLVLSVALAVDGLTPAAAVAPAAGDEGPVVGAFGVGDGLEAMIDERDGSAGFTLPVAGLALRWDSRVATVDRFALGPGWGLGLSTVDTVGGVRFFPPSGERPFPLDPTQPSGLAGYGVGDLRFDATPGGVLAGRADGVVGEVAYEYTLVELGRTTTYFDASGLPVARVTVHGERADWRWAPGATRPAQLVATVSTEGVITRLDWEREPGAVLVRPAANLPVAAADAADEAGGSGELDESGETDGAAEAGTWRIRLDGGRVVAVDDPLGGRIHVDFDGELWSRTVSPSGAVIEAAWHAYDDRVPRVRTIRTTDAMGGELGVREWRPAGAGLPSGWPQYGGEGELFFSGDPAFRYRTELSDGSTRVRSTYRSLHTLETRELIVSGGSGEHVLRAHAFAYPGGGNGALPDPDALPGNWSRPMSTEITHSDRLGASRVARGEYGVDDLGRTIRELGVDGTLTETEYDHGVPGDPLPPVGLAVRERVTAPDGAIVETRHTLNDERTVVIATETSAGEADARADVEPFTVTARVEYTVERDGFVSEQRVFPAGDATQPPVITRWRKAVDLGRGIRTITETLAAGSGAEATTSTTESLVHGGVVAEIDPLGNRATTTYDVLGRVIEQIDAAGRATTTAHERAGVEGRNAVTITTPDGVARTEELDPIGRTERLTDNLAGGTPTAGHERVVERRAYPDPGLVVVTDAWGATTSARQDALGREVETVTATGATTFTEYDDVANTVTTRVSPTRDPHDAAQVSVERFDASGRSVETSGTRADGRDVPLATARYDGFGRVVATDDGIRSTRIEHDVFGNAVSTDTTGAGEGRYARTIAERRFDGFGASIEKTLRGGPSGDEPVASAGTREFDALGRVSVERDQLDRESRTEYTPDGLVARLVSGSGQIVEHAHDPATRQSVATVTTSPVGDDVRLTIERDPLTDLPRAVFDPADRAGTAIRTSYDGFGNPTEVAYPDGRVIGFGYDEHGRRTRTTDAVGRTTQLDYDEAGRMVRAVQRDGESAGSAVLAEVEQRYDALGRVTELVRGNGVVTAYTYTSLSEIATETTTLGGDIVSAREYDYGPSGLVTERVDRLRDDATGTLSVKTATYEYDAFDRLIRSSTSDGDAEDAPRTIADYELTVGGDIRSERVAETRDAGDATVAREFEYSPLGELLAVTTDGVRAEQEYDAAGNLRLAADGAAFEYDAANRPVAETRAGQRTDSTYWADGSRRARSGDAGSVTFYWDGDELLTENHRGHPLAEGTASYLLGAGRHARTVAPDGGPSRADYFGTDRHGNVTELTDATGRPAVRYAYTDYGRATARAASDDGPDSPAREGLHRNPFQYAGGYADESGHLWLRVRSYDPGSMRFSTMDVADLLNGYHYADLNPIMMADPSGRTSRKDWTDHAAVAGLTTLFFAATVLSAVFTGGWSLSALGVIGVVADVAAMAMSFVRVDLDARSQRLDPVAERALFAGELVATLIGAVGAVHALGSAILGGARAMHRIESKLTHYEPAWLELYQDPKVVLQRWVRDTGAMTEQHVSGIHQLVGAAIDRVEASLTLHLARRNVSLQQQAAIAPISRAAAGNWLTRPLLAPSTVRRVTEQTRRSESTVKALTWHRRRLAEDAEAIEEGIAETIRAGGFWPPPSTVAAAGPGQVHSPAAWTTGPAARGSGHTKF